MLPQLAADANAAYAAAVPECAPPCLFLEDARFERRSLAQHFEQGLRLERGPLDPRFQKEPRFNRGVREPRFEWEPLDPRFDWEPLDPCFQRFVHSCLQNKRTEERVKIKIKGS